MSTLARPYPLQISKDNVCCIVSPYPGLDPKQSRVGQPEDKDNEPVVDLGGASKTQTYLSDVEYRSCVEHNEINNNNRNYIHPLRQPFIPTTNCCKETGAVQESENSRANISIALTTIQELNNNKQKAQIYVNRRMKYSKKKYTINTKRGKINTNNTTTVNGNQQQTCKENRKKRIRENENSLMLNDKKPMQKLMQKRRKNKN